MIRFTTDIIGAEILLKAENARLGPVLDLVFSPDDGSVLAFVCYDPIAKRRRVFAPAAVRRLVEDRILIDGYDSLVDAEDLIRLREAKKVGAKIIGEKVITESGQKLGKVATATVRTDVWRLERLYVDPANFLASQLLIPAAKIIKIEKKIIYVTDEYARIRAPRVQVAPIVE